MSRWFTFMLVLSALALASTACGGANQADLAQAEGHFDSAQELLNEGQR